MKKVLFATSALVLSAGFASAEVAVSGDGRMGVIYDGNDAQFSSRARVKFTLTGESDSGLSFGGAFRTDQESDYTAGYGASNRSAARGSAGAVWISGTYGKLSMGDVLGAAEAAIGDLYEIGYTEGGFAGDVEEFNYLVGDGENEDQGPTALYEYTVNNISFYASMTDGVNTVGNEILGYSGDVDTASLAYSLAAKYEGSNFWAALSYSKHDDGREIGIAAQGTFNNIAIKGAYFDFDDAGLTVLRDENDDPILGEDGLPIIAYGRDKTYGLSVTYQMDAIELGAFYRRDELEVLNIAYLGEDKFDSFGIGASYDLGGGAVLAGGIIDTDYLDDTVVDLGVKFSF